MSSIEISSPYTPSPNSAGGVDVCHTIFNASEKSMKYITFTYIPYNSVGDILSCTVKRQSEMSCKVTGPFTPGQESYLHWENVWYNPTVVDAKIKEVKIQYMDDTEETIAGEDILDEENPDSELFK